MGNNNGSKSDPPNNTRKMQDDFKVVAAVDFGTSFSGYAFSYKGTPDEIILNKNWGSEVSCLSYKTPTCVVTKPDGSFHSFGYKAELFYSNLDSSEHKIGGKDGYNLYRQFKMMLHGKKISLESTVMSTQGHQRKAIDIFAMALKYLFQHMLDVIAEQMGRSPKSSEVRLVLTVPAIWSDQAKAFMREAAHRAEIISKEADRNLILALEPEAASCYCKNNFKPGEQVLVLDAGGGTVDITVHEIHVNGYVKEVVCPSGGPWGGKLVDDNYVALLKQLFGGETIDQFMNENPQAWLELMLTFDKTKMAFKSTGDMKLLIELGYAFGTEISTMKKKPIDQVLKDVDGVSFINHKLAIQHNNARELFSGSIAQIVKHVKGVLNITSIQYVLLVGGYGACELLKEACKAEFGHKAVILTPHDAQVAVVKGAVLYGFDPLQIESRIARYTYGTRTRKLFEAGVHDPEKKVIDKKGEERSKDCFDVIVTEGERVKTLEERRFVYSPIEEGQTTVTFTLHRVKRKKVVHTDESGVEQVGQVILNSTDGPLGNDIEVRATFGNTETLVQARDKSKGENFPVRTIIDFISYPGN